MSRQIIVRVPNTDVRIETHTEEVWIPQDPEDPYQGYYAEQVTNLYYVAGVKTPAMCLVNSGDDWYELMFSANGWSIDWADNKDIFMQYPYRYC